MIRGAVIIELIMHPVTEKIAPIVRSTPPFVPMIISAVSANGRFDEGSSGWIAPATN
jgi:hypothetical protein